MRIRITGKGLKKYQKAGPVTASGQPVVYNKVTLRPGQSYTDPQTGKITTYEQALKKINDIENENVRTQASLDADYNVDEFNLDEQLSDTESDEQSSEQIVQKNLDSINLDYKIFTTQYDEVTKAEKLENEELCSKAFTHRAKMNSLAAKGSWSSQEEV